jgi:hypothetical protein
MISGATSTFTVPSSGQIIAKLFAGNDTFTLNEGTGTQPVGPPLSVDSGSGTNTLTVNGTAGADAFTITGTTVSLAGAGTLTYTNFQAMTVNGLARNDTFAMTGLNATTATTLDGGARVGDGCCVGLLKRGAWDLNGSRGPLLCPTHLRHVRASSPPLANIL